MANVSRLGDGFVTGHPCDASSTIGSASPNVYAEGVPVARRGDVSVAHAFPVGLECLPHVAAISGGSGTVFVNGASIARIGDGIDAGAITGGAGTVFAGG
jgi:uncharacterized Zn-binding protein involved in type VI secretion